MSSPVASSAEKSDQPKRKWVWRRLFQFRLRTILLLTTVVAIWLGWWVHIARQQREAVAELRKVGAGIMYDFRHYDLEEPPYWPAWLVNSLGVDCFADVSTVTLEDTQVTDADLAHLKDLTSLQTLYLDNNTQVTDAGLEHLKDLTSLEYLHLEDTQVTDAGLEHFKGLNALTHLILINTQVTDAGLEHLKDLNTLELLELRHTQVTDVGLEHLKGLNTLDWLFLEYTQVTDAGVATLQKSLPNCSISSH